MKDVGSFSKAQWQFQKAYINSMVAPTGNDYFLSSWRSLQLLCVLRSPVQKGRVPAAIGVILLSCIHLLAHAISTNCYRLLQKAHSS